MSDRPVTGSGAEWTTDVLTSLTEVAAIRAEWDALHTRALESEPFVSPGWLLTWWEAFGKPEWDIRFVTARRNGELVGVAPFYESREARSGGAARTLRFWENPYSNRIAPLLSEECAADACREIAKSLVRHHAMEWEIAQLGSMRLQAKTTSLFEDALNSTGVLRGWTGGKTSPYRDLPESWEDMVGTLGRSFRKTLNRRMNRESRDGLTAQIYTDRRALSQIFALSERTWQHQNGTGLTSSPEVRRFFEGVAEQAEAAGQLQIAILNAGERPIAYELNLAAPDTTYNLKLGYDPDFAAVSPGLVLARHTMQRAIRDEKGSFDFLGDAERYKMHWTDTTQPHGSLFVVRKGLRWKVYHLLRYRLKDFLERRLPWLLRLKRRIGARLRK